MINRVSTTYRCILSITIPVIIYNEYLCYMLNSQTWTKLDCYNQESCVKILLVADPQLVGEINENYPIAEPFTLWDSDRFLSKTYGWAVAHMNPHIVIFLGDLFDEGYEATKEQYNHYIRRFHNIFNTQNSVQYIWLPGDNDIGGEIENVSQEKLKIFNDKFKQKFYVDYKYITFTKINRMTSMFDHKKQGNQTNNLSIIVSHMPIVLIPSLLVDKILEILQPKIIFSGHEHKPEIVDVNKDQTFRNVTRLKLGDLQIIESRLDVDLIREFVVPTCSYRMGTEDIGYGAAVIDGNKTVKYTILWSPSRFIYLYIYFMLSVFIFLLILYLFIKKHHLISTTNIYKQRQGCRFKVLKNGV